MEISISFRRIEHDESVKQYIEDKFSRLQKYVETPLDVHVVLTEERKYRHRIDVMFTINGVVINAHEIQDEMRTAIDKILDKLERRLIRYRGKLKKYREGKQKTPGIAQMSAGPDVIVARRVQAKPMDADEAAMQLSASGDVFMIFRERESDNVCVIYKRKDGNFGLIEAAGK